MTDPVSKLEADRSVLFGELAKTGDMRRGSITPIITGVLE